MTLEEAIKHAEIIAEENQRVVDTGIVFDDVTIDMLYCDDTEVIEEHLANYQKCADEHKQLAEWLKELKQLRKQTEWIPVSERLPKEAGIYMTTIDYSKHRIATEQRYYYGQNLGWDDDDDDCVVAWMPLPLPEPYKVESENRV